jgi:hypothetical protein
VSGLSEQERESLDSGIRQWEDFGGPLLAALAPVVERIVAARVGEVVERVEAVCSNFDRIHSARYPNESLLTALAAIRAALKATP